jgi:RNA polymerase sigma-70 factor (ECF subfamily)
VGAPIEDLSLLARARDGDADAFASLVDRHSGGMLRVAMSHVPTRAVAEEVVQEAWLGVLEGLDRFEGRSSLKTWIYRILINRAISRGQRERRSVPFSSLAASEAAEPGEPAVDLSRFRPAGDPHAGHWADPPTPWDEVPEDRLLSRETFAVVERALAELPPGQRDVVTLRDVQGWTSEEVRNALDLSETNQRVLLHRGRSKLRRALEGYLNNEEPDAAAQEHRGAGGRT